MPKKIVTAAARRPGFGPVLRRAAEALRRDDGAATAEYAVATMATVARKGRNRVGVSPSIRPNVGGAGYR